MDVEIIEKAAKAARKQNRKMFVYAVAYRGVIISAIKPPSVHPHIECRPDGHIFRSILGKSEHLARLTDAA